MMNFSVVDLLGFGLAFAIQAAGMVWWASAVNSRVKAQEEKHDQLAKDVVKTAAELDAYERATAVRFAASGEFAGRLEERVKSVQNGIERMLAKIGG